MKRCFDVCMFLCFFIFLFCINTALAEMAFIPQTGQELCYSAGGGIISCPNTGQDGDIRAGVQNPAPRFVDNGNTVTDNLTGLMWTKNAYLTGNRKTWQQALDYVSGMNTSANPNLGYTDWRMPNIVELLSLVDYEQSNPALPINHPFINVKYGTDYYCSSTTTNTYGTSGIWIVMFSKGDISRLGKPSASIIWPVRDDETITGAIKLRRTGQTISYASGDDGHLQKGAVPPVPRFVNNGDSTVTDSLTDLMWTQNSVVLGTRSWQSALDYASGMNSDTYPNFGYTDWHLPNINELYSLMDFGRTRPPALPAGHPFQNISDGTQWTSTTVDSSTANAWLGTVYYGGSYYGSKYTTYAKRVWPVRKSTFTFPLHGMSAYTAPISSVMDQNTLGSGEVYESGENNIITSFEGEVGDQGPHINSTCYAKIDNSSFGININYVGTSGTGGSAYLCYDAHPGYDYSVPTGTDIHSPKSGTLCVATDATQVPDPIDVWRDTTHCPLPSVVITSWSGKHTFYIYHASVQFNGSINDYMTVFLHSASLESSVLDEIKQNGFAGVIQGQYVAESGVFGTDGPHVHMETYRWNPTTSAWDRIDPYGDGINDILW